jgi:hypothetical protein
MPAELTVECPSCQHEFKLTESLAAPLLEATREQYERKLAAREAEVRKAIGAEESRKARALMGEELASRTREIAELMELAESRKEKLAEAQRAQAEVIKMSRALEERSRELDLTVEKRVRDEVVALREQARREIGDELKFKLSERDLTIDSMKKQLDEMKRRMEQGSQQMQGELLELELESLLGSRFPYDAVIPVPKGEFGGDVLQHVCDPAGRDSGTILWESKRTKNWSDSWLPKLRKDQREANADVAVLVSAALPKGVDTFELIENVYVAHPKFALPLATVLRASLLELSLQKMVAHGLTTKTELTYRYLTSLRFRQRVEAMAEAFSTMAADLRAEKRAIQKQWAKRETQIEIISLATVGMYGDLQGIAGNMLPEIDALTLPEPAVESLLRG